MLCLHISACMYVCMHLYVCMYTCVVFTPIANVNTGPFNMQPENMEPTLFEASLSVAADLNARFGFNTVCYGGWP